MAVSRREFLKASVATSVAAGSLSWFGASEVFGADTVVIPSASHWGPFKAVVKKGVLVGVQPLPGIDAMPSSGSSICCGRASCTTKRCSEAPPWRAASTA